MKEDLYLIDGYALIFRAYFAFIRNPLLSPEGFNVSAIHGFTRMLLTIIKNYSPARLAICLDSRTPTFRDEMFPDYKATRDSTPEDLKAQFPVIEDLLQQFRIPTIRHNGVEADDIIATLARKASSEQRRCFVVSGDKDLYQLVDDSVRILKPSKTGGFEDLDRDAVFRDKGVWPEQIIDYLALLGDTADNVPGVKGIGQKTAEKLLAEYGTLDGIYEHLPDISSKNWVQKLEEGRENAYLSRSLVILKEDVDLECRIDDLTLEQLDGPAAASVLEGFQIKTLSAEISRIGESGRQGPGPWFGMGPIDGPAVDPGSGKQAPGDGAQGSGSGAGSGDGAGSGNGASAAAAASGQESGELSALEEKLRDMEANLKDIEPRYELVRNAAELERWVEACRNAGSFAFDTETDSLDPLRARLAGFSLCHTPGQACYVPVSSPEQKPGELGDTSHLSEDEALAILKPLLEDPELRIIGQNLKYDFKIMARRGIRMANPAFDTMLAGWLLDTGRNAYGMDALAEQYLGYRTEKLIPLYEEVTGEKISRSSASVLDFSKIPLDRALFYAAEDADITLRLARLFEPLLEKEGGGRNSTLVRLFHELEMPLVPILADMELEGISLDVEALHSYSRELEQQLGDIEAEIYELVGHEFNIASTKQLQTVLFEERGLNPGKKTKTGYSTDTSVLEELAREDRVPELVLRHRTLSKLKSTYVDTLPALVNDKTGRIHTNFQQNGTATGRISSHDPNLQNIPIRDEEGRRIRSAFVPREGCVFVSADYSQIELVVLAHLSGDPELSQAFVQGIDVHALTGAKLFGLEPGEVSSAQRRIAKSINFGVMYGMSAFRLAREMSISRSEASSFIESYFQTYKGIKGFIDSCVREAEEKGYVSTMSGRRRTIHAIRSSNKTEKMGAERVAVNSPIQGSAADIVKRAMILINSALRSSGLEARMLLQVHDELIFEVPKAEVEKITAILNDIMPRAVELSVPLRVNVESGNSWGEMH